MAIAQPKAKLAPSKPKVSVSETSKPNSISQTTSVESSWNPKPHVIKLLVDSFNGEPNYDQLAAQLGYGKGHPISARIPQPAVTPVVLQPQVTQTEVIQENLRPSIQFKQLPSSLSGWSTKPSQISLTSKDAQLQTLLEKRQMTWQDYHHLTRLLADDPALFEQFMGYLNRAQVEKHLLQVTKTNPEWVRQFNTLDQQRLALKILRRLQTQTPFPDIAAERD